jgi:hypothetical protein
MQINRPSRRLVVAIALVLLATLTNAQQKRDCVRVTLLQLNDVYQFTAVDQGTRGGFARGVAEYSLSVRRRHHLTIG